MELPRTWESGHGGIAEAQDTGQPAITDLTPVIVAAWSVEEAAATAIQHIPTAYTCDTFSLHLLVAIFIVVVIIVAIVVAFAVVVVVV